MRILIAEDDPTTVFMYGKVFKNHTLFIAFDGDAFLEMYNEEYDALIIDLTMPNKNGYEVINFLSTVGNKIPIFVVSAIKFDRDKIKQNGQVIYEFLKPYPISDIIKKIETCVK